MKIFKVAWLPVCSTFERTWSACGEEARGSSACEVGCLSRSASLSAGVGKESSVSAWLGGGCLMESDGGCGKEQRESGSNLNKMFLFYAVPGHVGGNA